MRRLTSIIDLLLRLAAGIALLFICFLTLVVGGMGGILGLLVVSIPALLVSAWLVICAFNPDEVLPNLPRVWHFVLIRAPVYAVACFGIYQGVFQWQTRYGTASVMIGKGDRQYPKNNPNPMRVLQITGTLPASVPVKSLVAIYTAQEASTETQIQACTRRQDFAPPHETQRYPLVHVEKIPIERMTERFRASVFIDQFEPGFCGWRLKGVSYLLDVEGYNIRNFAYWKETNPRCFRKRRRRPRMRLMRCVPMFGVGKTRTVTTIPTSRLGAMTSKTP